MKRQIFHYSLLALFCFSLGFSYVYYVPQLKVWARVQLHDQSQKHLPLKIEAKDVGLSFLPLGLRLDGVRLTPKAKLARIMAPAQIESARLGWGWFSLLRGKFAHYRVELVKPELTLVFKKETADPAQEQKPWSIPVQEILELPLDQIRIQDMSLRVRTEDAGLSANVQGLEVNTGISSKTLYLNLSSPKILVKKFKEAGGISTLSVETRLLLDRKSLQLNSLRIEKEDSLLLASGILEGNLSAGRVDTASLKSRVAFDMESVRSWALAFFPRLNIPKLAGRIEAQAEIDKLADKDPTAKLALRAANASIEKIRVGDIEARGIWNPKGISGITLESKNPAGELRISDGSFGLDDDQAFRGLVHIDQIELRQLLASLDAGEVPLHMDIQGELPCQGRLHPKMNLECQGTVKADNFRVWDDNKETIVATDPISIQGSVTVDTQKVSPKGQITIGESQGVAEGYVDFDKGFFFKYKSDSLFLKNLKNLANLKLEGRLAVEGTTSGDSNYAVIDMNLKGKDVWFEDYLLGSPSSNLTYKSGTLQFSQLKGNIDSSRYLGQVTINLDQSRLAADIRAPIVEARDMQKAFSRKVELPFDVFGTGSATVQVQGPFEFTKLSYTLRSSLNRGLVGDESFDQAVFNVSAKNGQVQVDRADVRKGSAILTMTGKGYPSGDIDVRIESKSLRLEQIDIARNAGIYSTGLMDAQMTLKGYVLKPKVEVNGKILQTMIGSESVPDSSFSIGIADDLFNLKAQLMGETIRASIQYPLNAPKPLLVDVETNRWHFVSLFSLFSGSNAPSGFESELTSRIKLRHEKGDFHRLDGQVDVSNFKIKRGSMVLAQKSPLAARLKNGSISFETFTLIGDNTELKLNAKSASLENMNMDVSGNIDLSMLSFLTPFLQDLRGLLRVSAHLGGGIDSPEALGTAYLEDGYAKLRDFPHPVESLKADVLFSQKRIIVNNFTGSLAGGRLGVDGYIQLQGYKDFPTFLSLRLEDTALRLPEGTENRGNGLLSLRGNWFPFTLGGVYKVREGLMSREFDQPAETGATIRRSSFLPRMLSRDVVDVLNLDLTVNLTGPYKVKNSMLDALITGDLNLGGTANSPIVLGEIKAVPGGTLNFRDNLFEVTNGSVKFDDPRELNPKLYGTARSRVNEYDVNLLLQGTMKEPRVNLSSQPPLNENDIISLLALGETSSELERRQTLSQTPGAGGAETAGIQVGTSVLTKNPLGKTLKQQLGVDVKVSSQIQGDDTGSVSVPKVTISKQWSKKMSTSASRTIGTNVTQDVKLKYQLNDNVSVIGNWEGKEIEEAKTTEVPRKSDRVGVDLEYRLEFK